MSFQNFTVALPFRKSRHDFIVSSRICSLAHHIFATFQYSTTTPMELGFSTRLWVWGATQSIGEESDGLLVPADVNELVFDVSAGTDYTLFIFTDGSAAAAGNIERPEEYQGHFACGCQNLSLGVNSIITIANVVNSNGDEVTAPKFRKVIAGVESFEGSGKMHSVFIDEDGHVYAAGNNNRGQLCLGDDESRILPTRIDLPGDERAESAAVGGEFTLILTSSGRVYGCGSNEFGQLGLGNGVIETDRPERIDDLSSVRSISAGRDFSLITASDGLYVMGDNTYGTLT